MGFTIFNDPAAGSNPGAYATQSRPDKVDVDILASVYNVLSGCAVTPHSSGVSLNVDIAAGIVQSSGVSLSVAAQANQTIAGADATNPRRDLISVNSSGAVVVTTGTAAATPDLPNVPAGNVALAVVDVPATATSIIAGNIVDKRMIVAPVVPTPLAVYMAQQFR